MHVSHGVVCHMWLYVCDAHSVDMHTVEEKALGISQVRQPIWCAYRITIKVEIRIDEG